MLLFCFGALGFKSISLCGKNSERGIPDITAFETLVIGGIPVLLQSVQCSIITP